MSRVLKRFFRYDPGALRLVRGIHLTLAVIAASLLAYHVSRLAGDVPGFTLSVVAGAAAAHVLLFVPISTRKTEASEIVRLAALMTVLASIGAVIGTLSGTHAPVVLQALWILVIAIGFGLDGLGSFWIRTGRMISIFWLFIIMSSTPQSPGIWLPLMAMFGAVIAFLIRIGLWRPSAIRTFRRVENSNRLAVAEYLDLVATGRLTDDRPSRARLHDLKNLRLELELSADLAGAETDLRGLSPETAAMMRLALEVVRDALAALPEDIRSGLIADRSYRQALNDLLRRIRSGATGQGMDKPDLAWARRETKQQKQSQFQILRIAQAFDRLWKLADGDALIEQRTEGVQKTATMSASWPLISWRLALQASVAAAVGYGIGSYFQLSHTYWITLTVIVVLCSSLGATVQKTVQRTLGTVVGFLIAILLEPLLAKVPEFRLFLIIAMLPPIIVLFERNYGIAVGFISFLVLIGLEALTGLPVAEFWSRLYDTMIGAGVGLAAAWLLFPARTKESVKGLASAYLETCSQFLRQEGRTVEEDKSDYARLRKQAGRLIAAAKNYRAEQVPWSSFVRSPGELDILILVLADYVILYRQSRAGIQMEASKHPSDGSVDELVSRMDKRIQDEIDAVLKHRKIQKAPGLAQDWLAGTPAPETADIRIMTDWVATLYYARKVIRCLDGLRQEHIWPNRSGLDVEDPKG